MKSEAVVVQVYLGVHEFASEGRMRSANPSRSRFTCSPEKYGIGSTSGTRQERDTHFYRYHSGVRPEVWAHRAERPRLDQGIT